METETFFDVVRLTVHHVGLKTSAMNSIVHPGGFVSFDLIVDFSRNSTPIFDDWQYHMSKDFDVKFDSDFDLRKNSGIVPCMVNKTLAAFELTTDFDSVGEVAISEVGTEGNVFVVFGVGPFDNELVAALAAASTLAFITGGTVTDPQSSETVSSAAAIEWAKQRISSI